MHVVAVDLHGRRTLVGLPPHVISVDELDPSHPPRYGGRAYYRKPAGAGVSVVARSVHGTLHGCDLAMPDFTPEMFGETLRSLAGVARSL